MQDIDEAEHNQEKSHPINSREISDRRILLSFYIGIVVAVVLTIPVGFILGLEHIGSTVTFLIVSVISAFFLTGIMSYKYNNKNGIIPTKRVTRGLIKISAASAPFFVAILFFFSVLPDEENPGQFIGSNIFFAELIGMYMGLFLGVFLTLMMFLFLGFGMIAVMSVLLRRKTPDMLVEITKVTPNITESARQNDRKKYLGYKWLGWAYGIPEVLDTTTLTLNSGESIKKFPRKAFNQAIKWQLLFGFVLIIYISFSPFLLDYTEMQQTFSFASMTTAFIPLFILPWFIYLRIDAKIQGPVKDFRLFDGLSSRMFQTIVAFGTLLLLVRLALRNPGFIGVLISMLIYTIFFIGGILIITFIYFNYFENDLAADIVRQYEETKEP
jgi:MFS family permease